MFKKKNCKKGQSTLEYMILVVGVVAVLLVFLGPNGIFQQAMNQTYNTGINGMMDMATRLSNSR